MALTIRPFRFDEADYRDLAEVRNLIFPDNPIAAGEWRRMDEQRDAKLAFRRMIAEHEGRPVGGLVFEHSLWHYHPQKLYASVWVHPGWQRRGFGDILYERLLAEVAPLNPLVLRNNVREDYLHSLRFAAKRGFVEQSRTWESRLDVATFDPAPFAGALERARGAGVTFASAAELSARDPAYWRKAYELEMVTTPDAPMPDAFTPPDFEHWLKLLRDNPNTLLDATFLALNGDRYVGLSSLQRHEGEDDLETGFTTVLREYRGKGIAMALKLLAIEYARKRGAPFIRTENHSDNRPMLRINEALGFAKQPAWILIAKEL